MSKSNLITALKYCNDYIDICITCIYQKTTKVILPKICFISQMKVSPWVTAKQLHFNFSFISVFLFFFILVLACFYLFLGEDILDSAVYNRNDNTNGHTNGVSEDGPRFDSSSPIVPEYGARTLGKTKNIFYLFIYFTLALRFLIFHNSIFSCISLRMIIPCAQL